MRRELVIVGVAFGLCGACFQSFDGFTGGGPALAAPNDAGPDGSKTTADAAAATSDAGRSALRSCKEIKDADSTIDADGFFPSANGELYCDMTTAGGGWTLIARTAGNKHDNLPFGWKQTSGGARDQDAPFSLGVLNIDLPFGEISVGDRNDDYDLKHGYRIPVTRDQLVASVDDPIDVSSIDTLVGNCSTKDGPYMLDHLGFVNTTDHYSFRDVPLEYDENHDGYGVYPDVIVTDYEDCEEGALANLKPAEIFVR